MLSSIIKQWGQLNELTSKTNRSKNYHNLDKKLREEIEDIKDRFKKRWKEYKSSAAV